MNEKIFNPLLNETFLIRPSLDGYYGTTVRPYDYKHPNEILRYADGQWILDDGQPDLAFIQGVIYFGINIPKQSNIIWEWTDLKLSQNFMPKYLQKYAHGWHYYTIENTQVCFDTQWDYEKHPNEIAKQSASNKSCNIYGCANGICGDIISEYDYPKWITSQNILIKSTRQPLQKPKNPICYLCLDNGRGHYIDALQNYKESLEYNIVENLTELRKAQSTIYDCEYAIEDANKKLQEAKDELSKMGITE